MSEKLGDGILSRNKNKYEIQNGKWVAIAGKDKHPDYTGKQTLKVAGGEVTVYVSAWVRQPKNPGDKPFMSLSLEYGQTETRRLTIAQPQRGTMPPAPPATSAEVGDEELPF